MKSISMSKEGYCGITGDMTVLSESDLVRWGASKDGNVIPYAIAALKGFMADVSVTALACSPTSGTLSVGDSLELTATRTPDYSTKAITWTSSATSYATVTADPDDPGKAIVKGVAAGTATITATCNSQTATCSVTVS